MTDFPEKYVPSWSRHTVSEKPRTRLLKVGKNDGDAAAGLDVTDEKSLHDFPLRIITSAYPVLTQYDEIFNATTSKKQDKMEAERNQLEFPTRLKSLLSRRATVRKSVLFSSELEAICERLKMSSTYQLFYLSPMSDAPYSYSLVKYSDVNKMLYLTITPDGVITHEGSQKTFTTLIKWERDLKIYQAISQLQTMKMYPVWKAFTLWKKFISCQKLLLAGENLEKNLFILDPVLREAFSKVAASCVQIQETSFPDLALIENFDLEDFFNLQVRKIATVVETLTEFHSQIVNVVFLACRTIIDDQELKRTQRKKRIITARMQLLNLLSFVEQFRRKQLCAKLCRMMNLIGLNMIEVYRAIVCNSYKALSNSLQRHLEYLPAEDQLSTEEAIDVPRDMAAPQLPFFHIYLSADLASLQLRPSQADFYQRFQDLLDLLINTALSLPDIVREDQLGEFTKPVINGRAIEAIIDNGPSLRFALQNDSCIEHLATEVMHHLKINFNRLQKFLTLLEPIHEFYVENMTIDVVEITSETDPATLRAFLVKYHAQIDMVNKIVPHQPFGCFHVHLDDLKMEVVPCCKTLLKAVESTIPTLGSSKVRVLHNECLEAMAHLQREPSMAAEFVAYLEFIHWLTDRLTAIEEQVEYVDNIYEIVEEFNVPCQYDDLDAHASFKSLLEVLKKLWSSKVKERKSIIDRLSRQIGREIDTIIDEINTIHDEIKQSWLVSSNSNSEECLETLGIISERLAVCQKQSSELRAFQKKFHLEVARVHELDIATGDLKIRFLLWETFDAWNRALKEYRFGDFHAIDADSVLQFVFKTMKSVEIIQKNLPENEITAGLGQELEDFQKRIPIMTYLRNRALKTRHWLTIETMLERRFDPNEVLTLNELEESGALDHLDELADIAFQASSEAALEALLRKIETAWQDLELTVVNHRDSKDAFILGGLDEIQQVLDESFININTILGSKHVGPIKTRVQAWHKDLNLCSRTLDEWSICQTNWIYLESIFSTPDIQRQLPTEARLFSIVDRSWKEIMARTKENPLAIHAVIYPGTLEALENNNKLIEQILKCLEAYLESKRIVFPRFYFLSNDELLEILAQTRNSHAVQPHLTKCFESIKRLKFGNNGTSVTDIIGMMSPEGEEIPFLRTVKARGNVENWLAKVEEAMVASLRKAMKTALIQHRVTERIEWVLQHPAQVVLAVSQILRCQHIHELFDEDIDTLTEMKNYERENFENLANLAEMVQDVLSPLNRAVLCSLITIDVHARDTITSLINQRVTDSSDFQWQKTLRYYWETSIEDCMVRMATACIPYAYEYLGASPRLVITPLTDKCYLCLMGALQLDLGGAPAGPAGTGKTESTKDLAKALAVQCVVFNCSDSLDYKMMGKFFSGLVQAGSWCCFDEFNRIDIEVLSVIAQQLLTIRNAKVARLSRFMFEGRELKLNRRCAVFVTMNPGYAGRTELPDNLKALFRPMAMMIPDYTLIAEVILYSEGFASSKVLAVKITQMYKLCSEQLSQQGHYDFGMRALKSVLSMAGYLKRNSPQLDENLVLIRALIDSNIPKFISEDNVLFEGILSDMFPGVEFSNQESGALEKAIKSQLLAGKKQPEPYIIRKAVQLYDTLLVRHGVMLVGPTGGGKTTVLDTLMNTITKLSETTENSEYLATKKYLMNPKAVSLGELYGQVNLATLEWTDGILGIAVRTAAQAEEDTQHWIVCDGPVDSIWIENLNTVLDDNKTLCLANSERIRFTEHMRMIFEVEDLEQASPATVSRCGMIYVDPNELRWLPYVKSWLAYEMTSPLLADEDKVYLLVLFEVHVSECLQFVAHNCSVPIKQVSVGKVAMLCFMLQALFKDQQKEKTTAPSRKIIAHCFSFALLWAIGGSVNGGDRFKFEQFLRMSFEGDSDVDFPTDNLWNFFVDVPSGRFQSWETIMPDFVYDPDAAFFDIIVPTVETVRSACVMKHLASVGSGVLFTGSTGVGKSTIAKSVLSSLPADRYVPLVMTFSAQTSSMRTQQILESNLEKQRKTVMGAPVGKKILLFIDDVNMPALDTFGSQPPIELLRQYLDFHGFYDREKFFWKDICDVIISAGCAPPGGGRNPLTPRFLRHFSLLALPEASEKDLQKIYLSIVTGFFEEFTTAIQKLSGNIVDCAIAVYKKVEKTFLPTPLKSHYVFNIRDLSKCIQGVLQANSGTMREATPILRLFYHECLRCYQDRLTCVEDKADFFITMRDLCLEHFGDPVLSFKESQLTTSPPALIFGDFLNPAAAFDGKIYEEANSLDKLREILDEYLNDYNLTLNQSMKLVLFKDALEHCSRVARILRTERGNGLLVGVSGMGKQSLTKLASHLNGYKCVQLKVTQSYNFQTFREDLRAMFFTAGVESTPITFLFSDNQIVQEEFLEDINNILNSGEVPNLFEGEDYENVINAMRGAVSDQDQDSVNRKGLFDAFLKKVKQAFHIIITMSPVGESFRRRCRMFPSLVNSCTIDWFMPWPREALLSVAKDTLLSTVSDSLGTRIYPICADIHESANDMSVRLLTEKRRYNYCTPSTYLLLLSIFKDMLKKQSDEIVSQRDRFGNGLQKLYETNDVVETMKAELVAYEPLLIKKSEATSELVKHLAKEQAAVDNARQIVLADEANAKVKAGETQILADDAQRDLAEAMPAMESAMKSLETLNKNDIAELKVFNKPPELVRVVMEAVCLLFGLKQDWATAKILLSDVNFLKRLRDFDKDHMKDSMLKILRDVYIKNPDFVPDKVATQSKVCRSLCMWVRALDTYAKVYKVVEPKRKALEIAESELNTIMAVLREKQRKLAEADAQIASLEAKLDTAVAEKAEVEAAMSLTAARLGRSSRLTTALCDEQSRWEEQVSLFSEQLHNMVGDILLSAACVAYFGPLTDDFRQELTEKWLKSCDTNGVLASKNFSVVRALSNPYEVRSWIAMGLPQDNISAENAVLVTRAGRWPLLVDPQGQAIKWIRTLEDPQGLKTVRLSDPKLLIILSNAVRLGGRVLIEDVGESLDPVLLPLLFKQTYKKGGALTINFNETEIDYDPNFKLYLSTKLPNPRFLPETCISATVINFTITASGIEEQLLADVVRLERPELESSRNELVTRINSDKLQLKSIEEKILKLLYGATGNILDDEELIDTLNESKETTEVTIARLEEAETTEARISLARDRYRPVAVRGAIILNVVSQLALLDPMYQYSFTYLSQIYCTVVESSEKLPDVDKKVNLLIDNITYAIYSKVSRGLFEKHKLMLAFLLCAAIGLSTGKISQEYWNLLLRGSRLSEKDIVKNPYPHVSDKVWGELNYVAKCFPQISFLADIADRIKITIGDVTISTSSKKKIPETTLTDFEKLIVVKAVCEEKLTAAITEFIKINLGPKFVDSSIVGLKVLVQDTSHTIPLVFILSPGSDPFSVLQKFAVACGWAGRLHSISLGQGQGPIAEKALLTTSQKGDWLFLQNCHLALSWMNELERKYTSLVENGDKIHSEFRLFLSSMPISGFPVSILQNAVKITNEPPRGLRANMKRSMFDLSKSYFQDSPLQSLWRRMVFGLCFFHAYVQERKNFGPLGWNVPYEFNDSDRDVSLKNLQMFCIDSNIPWDALQYITGEITYGGRVTDPWDLRCLKTALHKFFSPASVQPGYTFSSSGVYYCPESPDCMNLLSYRRFVDKFPITESAEVFGLSEIVNDSYKKQIATNMLAAIREMQPKESVVGGKSNDQVVLEVAAIILSMVVDEISTDKVSDEIGKRDAQNRIAPFSTVVLQETARYNALLKLVNTSLQDLKKAVKGQVVMTETLEEIYYSLINYQVPKAWMRKSYPSLKSLVFWAQNLEKRIKFINEWLHTGSPKSFWLSGFFFPQAFLTAALQTHSRTFSIPIDLLHCEFIVQSEFYADNDTELERPENGVFIHGLYLEAGKWDLENKRLSEPTNDLNEPFPVLWFLPTKGDPARQGRYECPLYKTSDRAGSLSTTGTSTNFILAVLLPTNQDPSFWVLMGTALVTELRE